MLADYNKCLDEDVLHSLRRSTVQFSCYGLQRKSARLGECNNDGILIADGYPGLGLVGLNGSSNYVLSLTLMFCCIEEFAMGYKQLYP